MTVVASHIAAEEGEEPCEETIELETPSPGPGNTLNQSTINEILAKHTDVESMEMNDVFDEVGHVSVFITQSYSLNQ